MRTVVAAIDADGCMQPVLTTATALADLLDATPTALHVRGPAAAGIADAAAIPLRVTSGTATARIVEAANDPSVAALVMGVRADPGGPRPAGHLALAVITQVCKPVALVPPEACPPGRFSRLLVPLDGTPESSLALEDTLKLAHRHKLEVLVLHVHTTDSTPAFSDHEPHATQAWETEFLMRHITAPHERVRLLRRHGAPADDIAAAATDTLAELVVLAWSQRLDNGRARVVAETIARARVPVVLLPVHA